MSFSHDLPGTDEQAWRDWHALAELPDLDLSGLTSAVVVAAHPDDETLGAGGLMVELARRGLVLDLVIATSGEGSHPASPTVSRSQLARRRIGEVVAAARLLAPAARIHLLQLPDGGLTQVRSQLAGVLRRLATPGGAIVAPWRGDAHPDHQATALAAAEVCDQTGSLLLEYPIWAWHWSAPEDSRVPWGAAQALRLAPDVRELKRAAIALHRSQNSPLSALAGDEAVLAPGFLAHFDRALELFFPTDFRPASIEPSQAAAGSQAASGRTLQPGFFNDFYTANGSDPWGFTDRWYERRKRALTLSALPRERFRHGLELGCSIGVLTEQLAPRCDQLLALDVSRQAVQAARRRLAGWPRVSVALSPSAQHWPIGTFDLVVLSEVGYYLDPEDLGDLLDRAAGCLSPDGVLVACHWRHRVREYPLTGDQVHRTLLARSVLAPLVHHAEEDFLLDVLVRPPAVSVAAHAGLAP